MASGPDDYARLTDMLEQAAERAFEDLLRSVPETFYYCTLATSGEALCPMVSAWSYEALDRESSGSSDPAADREILKWSYADSPYCGRGQDYFNDVGRLFNELVTPAHETPDAIWFEGVRRRMKAIEDALSRLDARGIFGGAEKRSRMIVVAEVMPPDEGNAERAKRLNAITPILREYLEEAI